MFVVIITLDYCMAFVQYSTPVLHRCVPTGKNAPGEQIRDMYDLVNSWSAAQQLLSDLYVTWPTIVVMCFTALRKSKIFKYTFLVFTFSNANCLVLSIVIIALMHILTSIISWLICILVAVSSIAITAVLWWTYYGIRNDPNFEAHSLLQQFVRNETAVYVLAILATIVMVFLVVIIYLLSSKLTGLAALFEEASKCMLSLPGLAGPPILAFIALVVFLAFWVFVVVCLVTANYPGIKPLFASPQLLPADATLLSKTTVIKNNSEADYKCEDKLN